MPNKCPTCQRELAAGETPNRVAGGVYCVKCLTERVLTDAATVRAKQRPTSSETLANFDAVTTAEKIALGLAYKMIDAIVTGTQTNLWLYSTPVEPYRIDEKGHTYTGYGCGKTHIALGILDACAQRGIDTAYWNVPDYLLRMRASYNKDAEQTETQLIEAARVTQVVLLDDLGREAVKETTDSLGWYRDRLFTIFQYRWYYKLPTIVTSNLDPTALQAKVGGAVASRMMAMFIQPIRMDGYDRRRERRETKGNK